MSLVPRRLALGAVAAASLFALTASSASAGVLVSSAEDCGAQPLSKPFTPWLDYANYTPLSSGTQSLASGQSIVSPSICVGLDHPTIRFFAKRESGFAPTSLLRVEVLFTDDDGGGSRSLPVGVVLNNGSWQPTLPLPIVVSALALDGQTSVAFRYTAVGGNWSIGDVWVDPWARK